MMKTYAIYTAEYSTFDASLAQQKLVKHSSQHRMDKVFTRNNNYATSARSVTIYTQIMFKCSYSNMPFQSISSWQSILQNQKTQNRHYKIANMQFQTMQAKKHISELAQEEEIDAVRPNFRPQGNFRQPNNFQKPNNQKTWQPRQQNLTNKTYNPNNQRMGNNSNKNGITCVYCKKQGHHQDNCRSRIRDNAPCIANSVKTYFPKKVNKVTNESTIRVFFKGFSCSPNWIP